MGKTEDALHLLETLTTDSVLLQARFNASKRQYNMGLVDFNEWSLTLAQINYAALEMANSVRLPGAASTKPTPSSTPVNTAPKPKVFISYTWADKPAVHDVKKALESGGCDVIIDEEDMAAGGSIMQFIENSIKNSDVVVSVVSGGSLQSGWVGGESIATMYAGWLADKKWIPVRLDNVVFDIDFQIEAQTNLNTAIDALKAKINKLEDLGGDARAFRDDLMKMTDLKNNLGAIIQRFKNVLMLDVSASFFDANMSKVLTQIHQK